MQYMQRAKEILAVSHVTSAKVLSIFHGLHSMEDTMDDFSSINDNVLQKLMRFTERVTKKEKEELSIWSLRVSQCTNKSHKTTRNSPYRVSAYRKG